jgi:hypothetical protein
MTDFKTDPKLTPCEPARIGIKINYYPVSYYEPIKTEEEKRDVQRQWACARSRIERAVLQHMATLLAEEHEDVHSIEIENLEGLYGEVTCPLLLTFKDTYEHTKFPKKKDG